MSLDLAAGLPKVSGDGVQLQQVVLNGLEAMREPTGRDPVLVIRTARAGAAAVAVAVEDAGTGIESPDADRMGLTIARTIVEAHAAGSPPPTTRTAGRHSQFTLPVDTAAGQ